MTCQYPEQDWLPSPTFEDSNTTFESTNTRHWLETVIETPIIEQETPSSTHSTTGQFYIDGHGARLPKVGAAKRTFSRSLPPPTYVVQPSRTVMYGFPESIIYPTSAASRVLDEYTYHNITEQFNRLCTQHSPHLSPYESTAFPCLATFQYFIEKCLEEFLSVLPVLHLPTLSLASSHWTLALALASIGCQYADMNDSEKSCIALHEFLRRAILFNDPRTPIDSTTLAIVKLLNCIGMTFSDDEILQDHANKQHLDVVMFCRSIWAQEVIERSEQSLEDNWLAWRNAELRRRLGYAIWVSRPLSPLFLRANNSSSLTA